MSVEKLEELYREMLALNEIPNGLPKWTAKGIERVRSSIEYMRVRNSYRALEAASAAVALENTYMTVPGMFAAFHEELASTVERLMLTPLPPPIRTRRVTNKKRTRFLLDHERTHLQELIRIGGTKTLSDKLGIDRGLLSSAGTGRRELLPEHIQRIMALDPTTLTRKGHTPKGERGALPIHLEKKKEPVVVANEPPGLDWLDKIRQVVREELGRYAAK